VFPAIQEIFNVPMYVNSFVNCTIDKTSIAPSHKNLPSGSHYCSILWYVLTYKLLQASMTGYSGRPDKLNNLKLIKMFRL